MARGKVGVAGRGRTDTSRGLKSLPLPLGYGHGVDGVPGPGGTRTHTDLFLRQVPLPLGYRRIWSGWLDLNRIFGGKPLGRHLHDTIRQGLGSRNRILAGRHTGSRQPRTGGRERQGVQSARWGRCPPSEGDVHGLSTPRPPAARLPAPAPRWAGHARYYQAPLPKVTVSQPLPREVTDHSDFGASSRARRPRPAWCIGGEVVAVAFKPGEAVKKGSWAVQLDPRLHKAALEKAEAEAERGAQASVRRASADLCGRSGWRSQGSPGRRRSRAPPPREPTPRPRPEGRLGERGAGAPEARGHQGDRPDLRQGRQAGRRRRQRRDRRHPPGHRRSDGPGSRHVRHRRGDGPASYPRENGQEGRRGHRAGGADRRGGAAAPGAARPLRPPASTRPRARPRGE